MKGIRNRTAAFSLLEVMVAVAILGLGLTVILTAQTGLFSSAKRAAQMSQAVGLARCKMSEIEVQLLKEGYQVTAENEEGPCCEDEDSKELHCRWTIAPVMLPELSSGADAGTGESSGEGTSTDPGAAAEKVEEAKNDMNANPTDPMGDLMGGDGAGMTGAVASMAMGLVWPQLKGVLEASIRKVTVQVVWKDGATERDLTVTQYLTNPQQGGLVAVDENAGGAGGTGGVVQKGTGGRTNQ